MNLFEVILYFIGAITVAVAMGIIAAKVFVKVTGKVLRNNAKKFIEGTKTNIFSYDGKNVHVDKFILRNKEDKDENINIKKMDEDVSKEE